ncbi:MAG: OmpA family protein [Deltaproteobacteria bacterium]|nr:OmpA family protein [Deltaproteobacteria bacterium]
MARTSRSRPTRPRPAAPRTAASSSTSPSGDSRGGATAVAVATGGSDRDFSHPPDMGMAMKNLVALFTAALFALAAGAARAEIPNLSLDLGLSGGGNLVLDKWDIGERSEAGDQVSPGHTGIVKGRVGFTPWRWLSLEVGAGLVPAPTGPEVNAVLQYEGDVLIQPFDFGDLTPFLDIGGFAYHNLTADVDGVDLDPAFHYGLGIRYLMLDWLALRAEARHVISDGMGSGALPVSSNLELTVGVDLFVWAQAKDRDGDGVVDKEDQCPDEAGPAERRGCPVRDRDGDGVEDADDQCPDEAGPAERQGCPVRDQDGDGVEDADDRCPQEAGPVENSGCPWGDTDGDGLTDDQDKCPREAGPVENSGCPWGDSDGDGLTDDQDKCPQEAGPAENNGCPDTDRDGDGIVDRLDNCPDEAGVKENNGCQAKQLVVLKQEKIEILDKVYFAFNKAVIEKRSFKLLDNVAAVLKAHPEILKIRVEGHTDSTGDADYNRKLSQERADAVRAYLAQQGVEEARLEAAGYGPDKPIEDNKTKDGRAKNRRVEFNIVGR